MNVQKFKMYSEVSGLSKSALSLEELIRNGSDFLTKYDTFIQFLGYHDASKQEVYEGDVLELKITDDLMNHDKDMFFNSNIGRCIEKEGDITSVILVNKFEKTCMTMSYDVYFCRSGKIERDEDNDLVVECCGVDANFPQYLCNKGATVIGNIIVNKDLLESMS